MDISALHHPATYAIASLAMLGLIVKVSMWVGGINEFKRHTRDFEKRMYALMDEFREDIKKLLGHTGLNSVHDSNSPVQLTELGKTISDELDAKGWAIAESPKLIENLKDKEEFEIYDACFKYIYSDFDPDEQLESKIRRIAYEHGMYKEKVLTVMIIELRDCLLEQRQIE